MDIKIERPILNGKTPEANLAIIDRWIADTADKLNFFIEQVNRERSNNGGNSND